MSVSEKLRTYKSDRDISRRREMKYYSSDEDKSPGRAASKSATSSPREDEKQITSYHSIIDEKYDKRIAECRAIAIKYEVLTKEKKDLIDILKNNPLRFNESLYTVRDYTKWCESLIISHMMEEQETCLIQVNIELINSQILYLDKIIKTTKEKAELLIKKEFAKSFLNKTDLNPKEQLILNTYISIAEKRLVVELRDTLSKLIL